MSANFTQLKKYDIEVGKTAEYSIYDIEQKKAPKLTVKPATELNKGYMNQIIKETRKSRSKALSAKAIEQGRKQDRDLYPKFVIVGWENVIDVDDKPVDFSLDDCKAFIDALPNFIFDELRIFCGEVSNFLDEDEMDEDELGE